MESSDPDLQSDHGSAEISVTIESSDDHSTNPNPDQAKVKRKVNLSESTKLEQSVESGESRSSNNDHSSGCFRKCRKDRKKRQVDHTIHSLAFIQDDSIDVENPDYDHEIRTIRRWREQSARIAFIFDVVHEKYQRLSNRYTLAAFIFTTLATLVSVTNLGINDTNTTLSWSINVVNAVLSLSGAICTAKITMLGWQDIITNSQKYLDTVEGFLAKLISEKSLSLKYRTPPDKFIVRNYRRFATILTTAPNIPHSDYEYANDIYGQARSRFRADLITVCPETVTNTY